MVAGEGIAIEDLSFRIGSFSIRNLTLRVDEGEYFVLAGPNGSGKTILIKLIAGLLRPESGDIRMRGKSIADLPPWRRSIGYVPQDGVLFPNMTVRGNIEFGLSVRGAGAEAVHAGATEISALIGIEELLGRSIDGLSGGEKQKVAMARALAFKPSVLLLDEPLSAVDEDARNALCAVLRKVQRESRVTTIHVAHSRAETQLVADRVGLLDAGRLKDTQ